MMLIREGNDYLSDGIYQPIVSRKCCKKAYLRGLFLGCGTISNPNRSYHLEFVLTSEQVANDLRKLIGSFEKLSAHVTQRKEDFIVYIKKADYISDILGIIGASQALLDFEAIKVNRSTRGEAQRISNCDNANVDRSLTAAEEQIRCIQHIKDTVGLDALSKGLREVAMIRLERPDASLGEIGEMLTPPVKKPAVSKRFAKIKEFAGSL